MPWYTLYINYLRMNHLDLESKRVFMEHDMLTLKTPPTFMCYVIEKKKKLSAVVSLWWMLLL